MKTLLLALPEPCLGVSGPARALSRNDRALSGPTWAYQDLSGPTSVLPGPGPKVPGLAWVLTEPARTCLCLPGPAWALHGPAVGWSDFEK